MTRIPPNQTLQRTGSGAVSLPMSVRLFRTFELPVAELGSLGVFEHDT